MRLATPLPLVRLGAGASPWPPQNRFDHKIVYRAPKPCPPDPRRLWAPAETSSTWRSPVLGRGRPGRGHPGRGSQGPVKAKTLCNLRESLEPVSWLAVRSGSDEAVQASAAPTPLGLERRRGQIGVGDPGREPCGGDGRAGPSGHRPLRHRCVTPTEVARKGGRSSGELGAPARKHAKHGAGAGSSARARGARG